MTSTLSHNGPLPERDSEAGCRVKKIGLHKEFDDLPKDVLNGSSFFEMDTFDVYFFDEENSVWRKPE